MRNQAIAFVVLCAAAPITSSFAQHGGVYDPALRAAGGPAVEAAEPGRDAFYKMFETLPDLKLTEQRALDIGNAIAQRQNQANPDNIRIPAGFTFLGQFLDHDMTLNKGRQIVANTQPAPEQAPAPVPPPVPEAINVRSGTFDLDSVYGNTVDRVARNLADAANKTICAPGSSPQGCLDTAGERSFLALYEMDAAGKPTGRFALGTGADGKPDLLRCIDRDWAPQCEPKDKTDPNSAILGDPRNDENVIIAQIHLLFLRVHNRLYEMHRGAEPGAAVVYNDASFRYARRMLTEHYQSIIRDEYLPLTVGADRSDAILRHGFFLYRSSDLSFGPKCTDNAAPLPHEFSAAAFRFGHSQIRGGYRLRPGGAFGFGDLFGTKRLNENLRLDFSFFFQAPGANAPQPGLLIDTVVSAPLARLPGETPPIDSLSVRNVLRVTPNSQEGERLNTRLMVDRFPLASGHSVAEEIKRRAIPETTFVLLTQDQLDQTAMVTAGGIQSLKVEELPLWAYILAEAEVFHGGNQMGPVGGLIVGEVMMGLLKCDDAGILRDPFWRPTLPSASPRKFTFADLVKLLES